jgi:hypothetical protein
VGVRGVGRNEGEVEVCGIVILEQGGIWDA